MVFDTIQCIFERNSELIGGSVDRQEKARKIMTQIVNSLTSKLEIGAPLASLYLLQNPDHLQTIVLFLSIGPLMFMRQERSGMKMMQNWLRRMICCF